MSSLLWLVVICFVCWLYLYVALTLVAKFIPSLRTVLFGPSWVFWVTFGLLVLLTSPMAPGVYRAARNDFLARLEHGAPIALTKSLHLREQIGRLTEVAFDASQVAQDLESLVEMQKERLAALLARYETNSHLSSLTEAQAEAVTARLAAAGYRAVRRERLINIVVAAVFMGAGYALSELDPVARWLTEG